MKITRENLKNIVREAMVEESAYQEFFKKALEKTGKSIPQMSDEEKKAFFNKIDSAWKGKGEKNEGNAFGAAVADAKKDGDDSFKVGGKEYKVESNEEDLDEEAVVVSKRTPSGNIVSKLKEELESVNEGTKPKFKVGDMVKYKGAKISAKVLKVMPTNWENGYLIQFQDTKKKEEAGESSLVSESVNEESINEGTDIYLNKRIQITKFAGQNGQMVQINAPKYQTAGDHIAMSKDEFIRMLKNSSKILNQLKESNESVNEAATDRDFEKVYSIFDKKDYFGIKGSIKTMLGNWQRALDKGDKGAQQYSKEDIIKNVTDTTKARAKHTYDELVNAINKKDIKSLKSKLRHDQPFSLTVFAQVTGKKLPKSTRDIHSFLDNEFMNESVNERIGSDKGEVGNANFKNRLAALKKSQGINKGDKVVVNYPTLIKPLKGIVAQILKSTNGNVYVLKGGNGVWDEKYVTKQ